MKLNHVTYLSLRLIILRLGLLLKAFANAAIPSWNMPFCGIATSSNVPTDEKNSEKAFAPSFSKRFLPEMNTYYIELYIKT